MDDLSTQEFETVSGEKPPVTPSEPQEAEAARGTAARRIARGTRHDKEPDVYLPKVADEAAYSSLEQGAEYLDPTGNRRRKRWEVKDETDYGRVPEGQSYVDPTGNERTKPVSEPLSYTAQTLYNMATNDRERRRALERSYPGKVRETASGLEIDDDGTLRKPKGITDAPGATLTSAAAPTAGAVGGEIAGGIFGNLPGAIGGAAAGSAAGQTINDIVLGLTGVYDRGVGEQAWETTKAAGFGGAGTAAGRAIGALAGAPGGIRNAAPKMAADVLGADAQGLETAIGLRQKGVPVVPPSMWAKEAPHLQNAAEVFDPAFRTQRPLQQAAEQHYERQAAGLIHDTGVSRTDSVINPTGAVPTEEAGKLVRKTATDQHLGEMAEADGRLAQEVAAARQAAEQRVAMTPERQEALRRAEIEATGKANLLIRMGFDDIEQATQQAMKVAEAGHNSGDLWWSVGEKLKALRQGVGARATTMYRQADELAGGHLPDVGELSRTARDFLGQLPEGFESRYPSVVAKMRDLAGVEKIDPKTGMPTGEWVKEPVRPSFGQLHNLRSEIRAEVDWYDLASDRTNGTYKFFENRINQILHDKNADPALRAAARQLDAADTWYAENIKIFNDKNLRTIMNGLRAGQPANEIKLAEAVLKPDNPDLSRKILDMVGSPLAAAVKAADVRSMLNAAKTLVPGQVDGTRFAAEVLERVRTGMLDVVHGEQMGGKLLKQAQYIQALEGKLDIPARPGDTAMDVITRARAAAEAAEAGAKQDPLKMLAGEMRKIEGQAKASAAKRLAEKKSTDPLTFLWDPTVGAVKSVDRILKSEDLILAAGARFGQNSSEFNMLRQIWTQRLLEGTTQPSQRLASVSLEIQNLMFPGVRLEEMQTLAREMDFLMGSKAANMQSGKSIAAQAKVNNPITSLPVARGAVKLVPGANFGARAALTQYYKMVTTLSSNLTFLKWVQKGLRGDEAARQMVREQVQRAMAVGGATGAGGAEGFHQTPEQPQ